jgi:O-methyltransferase involved in polyketide biosynthesis
MTDNETWGVATNLGSTAVAVAAQRAAETARDHPLIRDEFAALPVAAVGEQDGRRCDLSWMGPPDDMGRRDAENGRNYSLRDRFCVKRAMLVDSGRCQPLGNAGVCVATSVSAQEPAA